MERSLFKNARLVNEGQITEGDLLIEGQRIARIDSQIQSDLANLKVIDLKGKYLIPGIIDDQVHFREPGLTHKASIGSESRAAVAGGITSFMEMPNTKPPATTQELLEDKYQIAANSSPANYSFYMGAANDNLEEVLKTDPTQVCGVKIFMGSSTGNMLVDKSQTLEGLFSKVGMLMATHCEDEDTVRKNEELYRQAYGENLPFHLHPEIRSRLACFLSSQMAVDLAKTHGARLHILHITTAEECRLFDLPSDQKHITSEACVHHLYFNDQAYSTKGSWIKCNPAVKSEVDRQAIWDAVKSGRIDVIATDHAPHTLEEKSKGYFQAPSGLPLVQHSLSLMITQAEEQGIDLPWIVEKMCHAPANLFDVIDRGYLREGYFADLVVVDPDQDYLVDRDLVLYRCGWSPLEGDKLKGKVLSTYVNGVEVWDGNRVLDQAVGMRLEFDRDKF